MTSYDQLTKFFELCKNHEIELLTDDIRFICKKMNTIPAHRHTAVLTNYFEEWLKGMDDEENVIQRQNMGRRRANLYLLSVDNVIH